MLIMKRILITGGSGMLGSYIAVQAVGHGWDTWATYATHKVELDGCHMIPADIRDAGDMIKIFEFIKPEVVIHTSALVRPDVCETQKAEAFAVNVLGTHNVTKAAKAVGTHVVHVSTDTIFDGNHNPITEEACPSPVNYYGVTKTAAEAAVLASGIDNAIVRTSIIYGPRMFPWLDSFTDKIVETLRSGKTFKAFVDQFRQPIPAWNLADALLEIAERRLSGIYHVVSPEVSSRFQFARKVAEVFGFDARLIEPLYMDEVETAARRPKVLILDTVPTQRFLRTRMLGFEEGIYELHLRMLREL